jgi:hypothetical protein
MPSRRRDAEAHERLAIVKRGQILGFGALILMLATIVTLAAIGQPWVASIVATAGLAVIVAIFVTGDYQPVPVPGLRRSVVMSVSSESDPEGGEGTA